MIRTLSALYDTDFDADSAIRELEAMGIPQENISLIANNADDGYLIRREQPREVRTGTEAGSGASAGAAFGAVLGGTGGLLAGMGMLAIPGVGPVVAAGWLVAAAVGAAGGAIVGSAGGGLIGAMISSGVPEEQAHIYAEGVRRGGALVTVRVDDPMLPRAEGILLTYHPVDLAMRGQSYRNEGWQRFDEKAPPYTAAQIEEERRRGRDMRL